ISARNSGGTSGGASGTTISTRVPSGSTEDGTTTPSRTTPHTLVGISSSVLIAGPQAALLFDSTMMGGETTRRELTMSFANRVVLVPGAGAGLGRHLALLLAGEGAAVAALDLQPEPLAALAAELPKARFASAVADVTDRAALRPAVAQLEQQLGPVDVLFAN